MRRILVVLGVVTTLILSSAVAAQAAPTADSDNPAVFRKTVTLKAKDVAPIKFQSADPRLRQDPLVAAVTSTMCRARSPRPT